MELQEWAQQLLPVVQAAADGRPIECWAKNRWEVKTQPGFLVTLQYRVAIATCEVNGFTVPAPEKEPLTQGQVFYGADPSSVDFYCRLTWRGVESHLRWLTRNLVFLTKENAIAYAKALCGIDPAAKE